VRFGALIPSNDHVGTAALGCPGERQLAGYACPIPARESTHKNDHKRPGLTSFNTTIKPLRSFAPPDSRGRLSLHEHRVLQAFYRRKLPHLQWDDKPHFVTFCTHERWILPERARSVVLDSCLRDNGTRFDMKVAVILPDHAHLIFTPLVDTQAMEVYSLATIMNAIKGASAHRINEILGRKGKVWQTESFDHVLRASENLDAKTQYVLENPVRAGLVQEWREYLWLWRKAYMNPYALATSE
jgi:putative transposase